MSRRTSSSITTRRISEHISEHISNILHDHNDNDNNHNHNHNHNFFIIIITIIIIINNSDLLSNCSFDGGQRSQSDCSICIEKKNIVFSYDHIFLSNYKRIKYELKLAFDVSKHCWDYLIILAHQPSFYLGTSSAIIGHRSSACRLSASGCYRR